MARLKQGVSVEQAHAQLSVLWPGTLAATVPDDFHGAEREHFLARRIEVESAATGISYLRYRFARPLYILMALGGLVLLVACINVGSVMLAHAAARQQEFGIRMALGAGASRVLRQILTESVLLSLAGAALGLPLAAWTPRVLLHAASVGYYVPLTLDPAPDHRVLAFTAVLAVLTGLLFGLMPAWRSSRMEPADALQQNQRTVRSGVGRSAKVLVSAQIALSVVLVFGSTLFGRSLANLYSADLGYHPERLLLLQLFPQPGRAKISDRVTYYRQLAEEVSQLPGVESVGYSNMGPATFAEFRQPVSVPGSQEPSMQAAEDSVGPGFFRMMGMRLLGGREFDWRDDEKAPRVVIISESLARRLFPGRNPIGQKIDVDSEPDHKGMSIVGVVNSASLWTVKSREPSAFYVPLMQEPRQNQFMPDIRTSGEPRTLAASAGRVLESLGHHYSLRTETLRERLDMALNSERMIAMLSAFFGGLALLLASVGLYGLMSYTVTRRIPEIGIRVALGADRYRVLGLILREVMGLVLAGLAVGVPLGLASSRLISGLLFGIPAIDIASVAFSAGVLLGAALMASYLPAHRAARLDPTVALRAE
jgi:predicted permease